MIENNRNNGQIYGRNDMIMLDQNNKIYGSLGLADKYVMKTEEGTRLLLSNPKVGKFGDVLTEFNIYGRSEQKQYKGINLFPPNIKIGEYAEVSIPKGSLVFWVTDGTPSKGGNFRFFNEDKTEDMWFGVDAGTTSTVLPLTIDAKYVQNLIGSDFDLSKICLGVGSEPIYEPYTGGQPSPSPDYPQEIKSVGDSGNIEVNVRGKNLVDVYGYSANSIPSPEAERALSNVYGTTLSTTEKTDKLIVNQEIMEGAIADSYTSGYFCVGINRKLEAGKDYIITFKINVIQNPFHVSNIIVMFNGIDTYMAQVVGDKVTVKVKYNEFNGKQYVEIRNRGMSLEFSNFMITEVGETDDYEPYQEEQTVSLPYILNAIPVPSGGNYTDQSGQQYIADYVDMERGKFVKIVNSIILDGDKLKFEADSTNTYWNLPSQSAVKPIGYDILSNYFKIGVFFSNEYFNFIYATQKSMVGIFETVDELNAFVVKKYRENDPVVLYYRTREPIETDLTLEHIEQYKKLSTKTPTTIIENNYNTWMKATYKSTESV